MKDASVCLGMWKIETSEGLGQWWPTLNSLEESEGEEEEEEQRRRIRRRRRRGRRRRRRRRRSL